MLRAARKFSCLTKTLKTISLSRSSVSVSLLQTRGRFFGALEGAALIREIHTYGEVVPLLRQKNHSRGKQHKGLGKKLLAEAENIAKKSSG